MDPSAWREVPGVCGGCIAWRAEDPGPEDEVATGSCRLRAELKRVPASLGACDLYKARGQYTYTPQTPRASPKRRRGQPARVLRRDAGGEMVEDRPRRAPIAPAYEPPREVDLGDLSPAQLGAALRELISEDRGRPRPIHPRFAGGQITLRAGEQERTHEVERLFLILDRLKNDLERLEDEVSGKEALLPHYKDLVGTLRKAQGSLTTFNFLFADRSDYFSGQL